MNRTGNERDNCAVAVPAEPASGKCWRRASAIIALALLAAPAYAQEPSEEVKKAALMRAYHLNGDSMVGSRMIDMSGVDVTDPNVECFLIPGDVTRETSFDCRKKGEPPVVAAAAEAPAPKPDTKPDTCRQHGLRKVTEGKSWRCRK
jgi:hypothetical protein